MTVQWVNKIAILDLLTLWKQPKDKKRFQSSDFKTVTLETERKRVSFIHSSQCSPSTVIGYSAVKC